VCEKNIYIYSIYSVVVFVCLIHSLATGSAIRLNETFSGFSENTLKVRQHYVELEASEKGFFVWVYVSISTVVVTLNMPDRYVIDKCLIFVSRLDEYSIQGGILARSA